MGWGISLPSLPSVADVRRGLSQTVDGAVQGARDLGGAAMSHAGQLGRAGVDLGRQAVTAVRSVDVRAAAQTVRDTIGSATESARAGITTGVNWSSARVGDAADFARSHVAGDDVLSTGVRDVISFSETTTRFQLGVVGGVTREVVGTVGAVGQLGTTLTEMQLSPQAAAEYSQRIAGAVAGAGEAAGGYIGSVAQDPSRIGGDVRGAYDGASGFVGGQLDRYGQAIAEGRGAETIGMDVGTVATYIVPVGGGPARGLAVGAVREGGEALARGGAEALAGVVVRTGAEAGTAVVGRELAVAGREVAASRGGLEAADLAAASRRTGGEVALYRDPLTAERVPVTGTLDKTAETVPTLPGSAEDYGVAFFGQSNLKYYEPAGATLGREGGAFFHMPLEDSVLVTDAASAARYTGMAPSALEAYRSGGEIYGLSFPTAGLGARVPTAADASGYAHFLEGGHTAVRLEGEKAGFLVNPTRELVIPGGQAVPQGSVLFRLDGGAWTPLKQF